MLVDFANAEAFSVARRNVPPGTHSARASAFSSILCMKSVSRDPNWRRRRRRRIDANAAKNADDNENAAADGDLDQPSPLPPLSGQPLFLPCDAYSSARALVLSLLICGIGAGGGVGTAANVFSSSFASLSPADARAAAALAVEAAQLTAVSLVVSNGIANPQKEQEKKQKQQQQRQQHRQRGFFSFDLLRSNDLFLGIAGGAVAAAAVVAADSLLPASSASAITSSSLSVSSSSSTATDFATSTLAAASFPLGKAALLAAGCALAPATEELVFRGALLRGALLGRRRRRKSRRRCDEPPPFLPPFSFLSFLSFSPEIAASAAAFAASHVPVLLSDGAESGVPREATLLFVLGVALGATAVVANSSDEKEEGSFDLAAPIVAHALYNAVAYVIS